MLGIPLKARHLGRYRELLRLFYKYARPEWMRGVDEPSAGDEPQAVPPPLGEDVLQPSARVPRQDEPAQLADDLERLGPTFVKLGQLLSTRSDLLPPAYIDALSRLQDDVEPFRYDEVERLVEAELGVRLQKLFPEFDKTPLAAASLGQTHRARLRDGREVAVKVQRPGIRQRFMEDLAAISEVAAFLDQRTEMGRRYEFQATVDELRRNLFRELDYLGEARNLRRLAANLTEFDRIVVPLPHEDYSTSRVLTMDFVRGCNVTSLTPLRLTEIDGAILAGQLFRAYLKQILVDGFFHADPHPGNVLLTDDRRVALIDLGMTAALPPHLQEDLLTLLLAVVDGRSESAADIAIKIGHRREGFNEESFRQQVSRLILQHKGATLEQIDTGRVILEISRVSRGSGLRLPNEMTMLGKALLNLDQAVWVFDPRFDPNEAIRKEAAGLVQARMRQSFTQGNVYTGIIELKKFAEKLPDRMGRILDVVGDNRLEVKVKAFDEKMLIEGMQKIANRIALGVVLGSLIVGAALLMQVDTRWKVFGYPGLAIVLFLAAAAGAVAMVVDILYSDEKRQRQPRFR
jgi:predicted unusual protein kinase regulating ubiquinone biosynthesis (AarF/ABC1/UbiB family)